MEIVEAFSDTSALLGSPGKVNLIDLDGMRARRVSSRESFGMEEPGDA
jgi:hypothetical protein